MIDAFRETTGTRIFVPVKTTFALNLTYLKNIPYISSTGPPSVLLYGPQLHGSLPVPVPAPASTSWGGRCLLPAAGTWPCTECGSPGWSAASGNEAFDVVRFLSRRLIDQAAWNYSRSPTHSVTANLQENYNRVNKQKQFRKEQNQYSSH